MLIGCGAENWVLEMGSSEDCFAVPLARSSDNDWVPGYRNEALKHDLIHEMRVEGEGCERVEVRFPPKQLSSAPD